MKRPDICIAGAGIIGLTLALALRRRNLSVLVLSAGDPMAEASTAAAGMLAVHDPGNPPELLALSRFSHDLYPELLSSLRVSDTPAVDFQTHRTLQALAPERDDASATSLRSHLPEAAPGGLRFNVLAEESLDPRELASALLAKVAAASLDLESNTVALSSTETAASVVIRTSHGVIEAGHFIDCTGAWSLSSAHLPSLRITPRKGQMLTVATPPSLTSGTVVRSHDIYMVPRLRGRHAGQTVVGATVEDVGFDRSLHAPDLRRLLDHATRLLPEFQDCAIVSSWSGLRPATEDLLPAIGRLPGFDRLFIASGHYRNGILLAPGTAELLARLITGDTLPVSLEPFSPRRFATTRTAWEIA